MSYKSLRRSLRYTCYAMSLSAGDRMGPYQLLAPLGAGGMGVVWKALDTRLDREVALKFLTEASTSDPVRRERFVREAKAASALNHPNIVTIYEINSESSLPYIAMELIRGQSLSALLAARRQFSPADAVRYAAQLCDGLGKAHRAGIVHRDIKPSNIMLTDEGLIKILDFGLVKLLHQAAGAEAGAGSAPLTVTGIAQGTVPYMSPEQAAGQETCARSDVFSVGIVLYEMVAGQRPFRGASRVDVMRALLAADPPPLNSVRPDIPEQLTSIIYRCLKRNPDERYRDAAELAADLHALDRHPSASRVFDQTTVVMTPVSAGAPARRRNLALVLLAILAIAGALGYRAWQTRSIRSPAGVHPAATSSADATRRAREYLDRYDRKGNVDRAIDTLEAALGSDSANAALHATLAEAYVRKYSEAADKKWLLQAIQSGRQAVAANDDLAIAHLGLGMALASNGGDHQAAAAQLERARQLDPLSAPAHVALAKLRFAQNQIPAAEQLYQKAVELAPGDWLPLAELGLFYYRAPDARYDEAVAAWLKALKLAPDNVLLMKNLAAAYHMKGQDAEAANMLQQALVLDANAATWANLGTMRYFQGLYAESARAMEKAVNLAPKNYLYWGNLGDAYRWAPGLRTKAGDAYSKAIALAREQLAANPNDAVLRSRLAGYLAKSGQTAAALAQAAQVAQASEQDTGAVFKTALVYEIAGRRDQALAALERAIQGGYSMHEVANEPELAALRADSRYQRIQAAALPKIVK